MSVRNNSSCLRGTGVFDKGALDRTIMGVMFLDSFLQPTHTPSPHGKHRSYVNTNSTGAVRQASRYMCMHIQIVLETSTTQNYNYFNWNSKKLFQIIWNYNLCGRRFPLLLGVALVFNSYFALHIAPPLPPFPPGQARYPWTSLYLPQSTWTLRGLTSPGLPL